jgi:rubrerythrin
MELGTVGAVLTYAIRLEGHSVDFYEQAASATGDAPTREVFLSWAEAKRKRKKVVERSRREFVNEMLLEPIEGLEGSDSLLETVPLPAPDPRALLQLAKELEEGSQRQYSAVTAEISHLPQLARVFRKLGEGNSDHKSRLESLNDD